MQALEIVHCAFFTGVAGWNPDIAGSVLAHERLDRLRFVTIGHLPPPAAPLQMSTTDHQGEDNAGAVGVPQSMTAGLVRSHVCAMLRQRTRMRVCIHTFQTDVARDLDLDAERALRFVT